MCGAHSKNICAITTIAADIYLSAKIRQQLERLNPPKMATWFLCPSSVGFIIAIHPSQHKHDHVYGMDTPPH